MDKASGPLTLVKSVRDSAEFFMTAGPRASHSSDQRVGVSSPSRRTFNADSSLHHWGASQQFAHSISKRGKPKIELGSRTLRYRKDTHGVSGLFSVLGDTCTACCLVLVNL